MKRTFRRSTKPKKVIKHYKTNEEIKAPHVRLVDEKSGSAEVIPTFQALEKAKDIELDLVEVSPNADPPVVKIMDYGKVQYQKEKISRKQKASQKKVELKVIRLTARISEHDINVRLKNAVKFLGKGAKVKVELILRGREHQHIDIAKKIINDFIDKVKQEGVEIIIEQPVAKLGSNLHAIIAPKNN